MTAGVSVTAAAPQEFDLPTASAAFLRGLTHAPRCATTYALMGMFVGTGALAHDFGFSLGWTIILNTLVWAGPAQLVLITLLGAGVPLPQIAIAVALSGVRLFPMVVTVLPQLRDKDTPRSHLLLPAHFTAITFMLESLRVIPHVPRHRRITFCNGYGVSLIGMGTVAIAAGHMLAASLPPVIAVGLLFLAAYSFLLSAAAGCRNYVDWIALGLGGALMPLVAFAETGIEILICGIGGGTIAYAADRWRRTP
jgi:predicted branched-subunit amino acid permease